MLWVLHQTIWKQYTQWWWQRLKVVITIFHSNRPYKMRINRDVEGHSPYCHFVSLALLNLHQPLVPLHRRFFIAVLRFHNYQSYNKLLGKAKQRFHFLKKIPVRFLRLHTFCATACNWDAIRSGKPPLEPLTAGKYWDNFHLEISIGEWAILDPEKEVPEVALLRHLLRLQGRYWFRSQNPS